MSSSSSLTSRRPIDHTRKKLNKLKSRKYSGMRLIKPSSRRVRTVLDSPSSSSSSSSSTSDHSSSDHESSVNQNQSPFQFPPASPDFMTPISFSEEGRDVIVTSSRNYLKPTTSSDGKKTRSQGRIRNSSNDGHIETKSQTPSARNFGFLMNKSSFKYRKPATKNVNRNTCSSSLKDCKFPSTIELQMGERESLITPTMKVCPYTYCSLHGHHHKPPLPRFRRALSKNRRTFRSQRSMKFRGQSSLRREQCIDDLLKEIETIDGDPTVQEISIEFSREDDGSEVETEEQTDLQADDDSSAIQEEDDDDTIAESKPNSEFLSMERCNVPLHNLENTTKTREHEERTNLQAVDDSSAIQQEDDADTIAEPNPDSEFLSTEMQKAPLHNLENATKTREHEEHTDLQADDDSTAIQQKDDAHTIAEPNPVSKFHSTEMQKAPLHNLENAIKTREHEEQTDLQADDNSSAIQQEDDADTIAEPNPDSDFHSTEMQKAPLHNLENAIKTREHKEQTDLQADHDSSAIQEEDDIDTIAEPNPDSEFLSTEMQKAPLHNLENATKTREHEEPTDLQADDSSAIEDEDDTDTLADPNPTSEFLSAEMHNAPLHNLENAFKTRDHEEQTDLQADDSSAIEDEDDTDTLADPNPTSEFLSAEMHNAPLHNLENASKTRDHEEQTDLQADDSGEEDNTDTLAEPNPDFECLSTEMHNAPLDNLENAFKIREHEEQIDLQADDSSEEDDTDTLAEPNPDSELLSTEMHNAPLHTLENASKIREHEEEIDLQTDDSSEEDDTNTLAEPNPDSELLSTEMHNAPLHNLENASKIREHEEQIDLHADDSSEEDDTDTLAEPNPDSELLSTELHNAPLHNLENASKTRRHEDTIEIPCSPNSPEGFVKQDCENDQICPDEDSEQIEKIEISNTPLSRRNHVSMWRLINRHMVLGLLPSDENPKTEISQTEDHEIEVRKIHAVKLVREAIEKILLPEVQDDQSSVCSDITTDQEELIEENSTVAEAKGNKSEKKAIKNWSNLKKLVLLKRFIKELEKVKRLNLSRQQSLPLGTESDGEKINLRHQTTDAKKKTEEWMLDYALRKVVSELAPTQQKKVALLVKAFETVGPTPEEGLQMASLSFGYSGDRNLNAESFGQQSHQDEANIISTEPAPLDKVKIYKSLPDDSCIASITSSSRSTTPTSLDHDREVEEKDGTPDDAQAERQSPNSSILREVFKRKLNKSKGLGMWNLIHQNMVQGLHHKKESPMPEDNDDFSRPSSDSSSAVTESDDYLEERLEIEERKINTIKLVREAIENILLPAEFQDHQKQLLEKKHTEETDELIATDAVLKDNIEEKSSKQALKSWSSLKKMILLKRFIKELEKVKKTINPRDHLPIKSEPGEEEGVLHLRRKTKTSDKKNSEEWMLDFALRQVVSELAPVQKRKVALLVKAFETVAPPSEELNLQIAAAPKNKNNKPIDTVHDLVSESGSDHSIKLIREERPEEKRSEKSNLDLKSKLTTEKTMDKRQYISMWHQLCQHVVSTAEEKVETEQMNYNGDNAADMNKREFEFKQSDATRLVKEAIGEIMSQETKDDSSDTQSTCSEQEERQGGDDDDSSFNKQMAQAVKMSKSDGEGPKKWSKVRKLIILKRTIKALENARKKYTQRPPQFLALKPEIGAERIDLRQQMIDERKKAEDWMLDYALQNIVTKLTPARKRRVSMLVEAFEAVVPLPAF